MRWQIGDVRIVKVPEMLIETPTLGLFDISGEVPPTTELEQAPPGSMIGSRGGLMLSVHGLVVETPSSLTLVDPCMGLHRDQSFLGDRVTRRWDFLDELQRAGFSPADVDTIVCTHLHHDHVGWMTRPDHGRWIPTFPRARMVVAGVEYEEAERVEPDGFYMTFDTAVRPMAEAGSVELVDAEHSITREISMFSTPGHSAGHASLNIVSKDACAVITGDVVHHPWQFEHPEWIMRADEDPERARATRVELIERCLDMRAQVLGTHFGGSSSGFVRRKNGAATFMFDDDPRSSV